MNFARFFVVCNSGAKVLLLCKHGLLKKVPRLIKYRMARIFSIHFTYEHVMRHAMVSVRTTPFFTEYSVAMLDEAIAGQLPNNKIISTSKDSFVFSDSAQANAPQLMAAILFAVKGHVQTINA